MSASNGGGEMTNYDIIYGHGNPSSPDPQGTRSKFVCLQQEALEKALGIVDGVIWLDNNIHNYGSDEWRGYFKAVLRDARNAHVALVEKAAPPCKMCDETGCPCARWRDWWSMDECDCGCPVCGLVA